MRIDLVRCLRDIEDELGLVKRVAKSYNIMQLATALKAKYTHFKSPRMFNKGEGMFKLRPSF